MSKIVYKNLKINWGEYDYKTKTITIRKGLKERYVPSKLFVLRHEEYHHYLDIKGYNVGGVSEEILCDLWAIISLKKKQLSFGDILIKRDIKNKFGILSKFKLYKLRGEIINWVKSN